ncbi:D-alanine--D-alanine ligase [Rapidithrix thailandica]|uniref:D-alanine--D-alanine ligase n=1 Tax=Rapidithrix thailandica TaxID=413964 RepID=A0AAW9SEW9_9BACT
MRVGVFFGGQSREREVSFAGGRTVYDNLNKSLFEPIPIFVDSKGNFILLDWQYIYKGTIRDFYPPINKVPASANGFQIYLESLGELTCEQQEEIISEVGRKVQPEEFRDLFDFAFLALHGPYGEDGNIQGLLEWYGLPYSGSGILPSAIGIDKSVQKQMFKDLGLNSPATTKLSKSDWLSQDHSALFHSLQKQLGFPFVVKAPHQGSSIGVAVINTEDQETFERQVNRAFFMEELDEAAWSQYSPQDKLQFIAGLVDIRSGIGLPVFYQVAGKGEKEIVYHPEELLRKLDAHFAQSAENIHLQAWDEEEFVLFEAFIKGREFSCIVVEDENGQPLPLPPTEVIKVQDLFDYRSKYLPGMSRKRTPIDLDLPSIRKIQKACCELYQKLHFDVYARIDGFITEEGEVFLNDPNTTSGMMPSSFFFHQAAEIGLNPSQFLTFIIRTSLAKRLQTGKRNQHLRNLLEGLDGEIASLQAHMAEKTKVAVIMGGYSSERHISVESGRNIYEKLASSEKYEPVPIFLTGSDKQHELYVIPVNILLKDNADDIRHKITEALETEKHPVLDETIAEAKNLTSKYAGVVDFQPRKLNYEQLAEEVGEAFIALHGRPGEDGAVQKHLDRLKIPYNGSGVESSQITIDKYKTNEILRSHGIKVAKHYLLEKEDWLTDQEKTVGYIEKEFPYPLIAKPADDGCSSAVKKIDDRATLEAFARSIFREEEELNQEDLRVLNLQPKEEFPQKKCFLIEEMITKTDAEHFLEITGGMLTQYGEGGVEYEVFEPSEALASKGILSLEEKFLAGEGQNITPARFAIGNAERNAEISKAVRGTLEKVARILQVEGYCRVDAFVKIYADRVETYVIEVNSLPGMTPATCIFHQCAIHGYKPYEFIDNILEYGKQRL